MPTAASLLSTLTEEGLAAFDSALGRVLQEGIDQDVEVDFLLPPRERRTGLMSIRALLRKGGEVSGTITSIVDVTDRIRAREELEKRATFDALTGRAQPLLDPGCVCSVSSNGRFVASRRRLC